MAAAVAGCGGAASTATPSSATPATTPQVASPSSVPAPSAVASPTVPVAVLPTTPLRTPLSRPFASQGLTFDRAKMGGLGPGDLIAQWYQDGGFFVVAYVGLDVATTGPLCPGNSLQVGNGFQYVSNAPTSGNACAGVATLLPPPVGVRHCGKEVLYRTAIPATAMGILWASINSQLGGGSYVGLSGVIDGATGTAPQVSLDALGCRVAL